MDTKQLQTWLKENGFDPGKIDGIFGKKTKLALQKAQQYLTNLKLYKHNVDGILGNATLEAINTFNRGNRYFNKYKVKFNIYDQRSVDNAVKALRSKGIGQVRVNGNLINLKSNQALNAFRTATSNMAKGIRFKPVTKPKGLVNNILAPIHKVVDPVLHKVLDPITGNTQKSKSSLNSETNKKDLSLQERFVNGVFAPLGFMAQPVKQLLGVVKDDNIPITKSSLKSGNLNDLVERYAFDKYNGVPVNDDEWGISYNYTPHNPVTGGIDIGLHISDKYTPEQARQIAIGAGLESYKYKGKKYNVNLFDNPNIKTNEDFENYIKGIGYLKGPEAAQEALQKELARQFKTYGIDYNQLKNKTGFQWNNLFGVVPYGYSTSGVKDIALGTQTIPDPNQEGKPSSLGMSSTGYRYNPNTGKGRYEYNDYTGWKNSRRLAQSGLHNKGISGVRASASAYAMGYPVPESLRNQFRVMKAKPNGRNVDFTNYYELTDPNRGSSKMQAWVYNEVSKNPKAALEYFKYIYGDLSRGLLGGDLKSKYGRSHKFDEAEATRLAKAAGLSNYHLGSGDMPFKDSDIQTVAGAELDHDIWGSLKSFYENAYDDNGNLKSDFKYAENGYDHKFDGGGYTVTVKEGKPVLAEDVWNMNLRNIQAGMNAGRKGRNARGVPMLSRFQQGGLIDSVLNLRNDLLDKQNVTSGKKQGDKAGTDECAAWSNGVLRKHGYLISGNAWALNDVDTVYSGYDFSKKPTKYNRAAIQKYNSDAADTMYKEFDSNTLDKSQPYVVNMFYKGSPAQEKAFKNGKEVMGTHTGILSYKKGKWVVTHNIHGTIHEDSFTSLQNGKGQYGVTTIYRPRKESFTSNLKHFLGFKYGGCITSNS